METTASCIKWQQQSVGGYELKQLNFQLLNPTLSFQ